MAFTLPAFNLTVDIYSGPWLTRSLRVSVMGNFASGRRGRVLPEFDQVATNAFNGPGYLLIPAGTDIRDLNCNQADNDIVEIPSGSGRWYGVAFVDDIGKGFSNEHRLAVVLKISQHIDAVKYAGLFWPSPIP